MNATDLILINPSAAGHMPRRLGSSFSAIEPPVEAALLASFVRERGFSVKIIDADAEGLSAARVAVMVNGSDPLLVGVGAIGPNPSASSTPKMEAARAVLNTLRDGRSPARTFLYGIHPSALPERTLGEESVDFVVRGEPFYTVARLLEILKSGGDVAGHKVSGLWHKAGGAVVPGGWGKLVRDPDELPFAAWDLLPMAGYRAHNWHCFGRLAERTPYAVIYTSFGCPFNCTYCNIHAMYNGKPGIRFRSPLKVADELDILVTRYKVKNVKIADELFAIKEGRVIELCDIIIGRGYDLNMWAYARIDTVTGRMLEKMKRAGINWVAYGIESADEGVRSGVAKGKFVRRDIEEAVRITHDAGINIIGNFIFGLPDDDPATMRRTLDMAKGLDLEYVNFYATMAYPGSKLYEEALKDGSCLPGSWSGYAQMDPGALPLSTRHIPGTEVLRFRDEAFAEYFSDPRYLGMVEKKFGPETLAHVKEMSAVRVPRHLYPAEASNERIRR
ncbi:MAG: radical SAM protein [Candidatus Omnitrophota bacterium]